MTVIIFTSVATLLISGVLVLLVILLMASNKLKDSNSSLKRELEELRRDYEANIGDLCRSIDSSEANLSRSAESSVDGLYRDLEDVKKYVDKRYDQLDSKLKGQTVVISER